MRQWILFSCLLTVTIPGMASADVDYSACFVRSGQDHVEGPLFHEFRHIVYNFNRNDPGQQCTDLIQFEGVEAAVLNASMTIGNPNDRDCSLSTEWPEVCNDGWGLVVDGGEEVVDLDVNAIPDGTCAITVTSGDIQFKNINFRARINQINAGQVICAQAPNVDYSQTTFNGFAPLEPTYFLWSALVSGPTVNSKAVKLGWNYVHARTDFNFIIERAAKNSVNQCQTFSQVGSVSGTAIQFQDIHVAAGAGYCYRVQASRGVTYGAYSNTVLVNVPAGTTNPSSPGTFQTGTFQAVTPTGISTKSNIRKWTQEEIEARKLWDLRNSESRPH